MRGCHLGPNPSHRSRKTMHMGCDGFYFTHMFGIWNMEYVENKRMVYNLFPYIQMPLNTYGHLISLELFWFTS